MSLKLTYLVDYERTIWLDNTFVYVMFFRRFCHRLCVITLCMYCDRQACFCVAFGNTWQRLNCLYGTWKCFSHYSRHFNSRQNNNILLLMCLHTTLTTFTGMSVGLIQSFLRTQKLDYKSCLVVVLVYQGQSWTNCSIFICFAFL